MTVTLLCAAAVAALMVVTWAISLRIRDASIVDPVWGPAFVVVALVAALAGDAGAELRWLLLGLTALWGMRLGIYLTIRKLDEPEEDYRYRKMRDAHPNFGLWSLFAVFGLQALLVMVVSLPLQLGAITEAEIGLAVLPGVLLWAVGLAFESVGDAQLRAFKADPDNEGEVMDRGLWRYTRHPNYFGDFCVWWGLWLIVLTAGGTWWTAIGPIVMSVLLIRVSGAGLLEKDLKNKRPAYREYIERTSGFFPLPPKQ